MEKFMNTVAIMSNGMKIRVNHKSDPRNVKLFSKYVAEEIVDLDSKTKK